MGIIFSQANNFFNFILSAVIILSALIFIYFEHKIKAMLIFFVIFIFGLAYTKIFESRLNINYINPELTNKNIDLEGVIKNLVETKNYYRVLLRSNIKDLDFNTKIKKIFYVQAYIKKNNKITPGDKIILTGKLIFPEVQRNPGCFDEQKYFKIKNISYKIFAYKVINLGRDNYFIYYINKIKNDLGLVYNNIFDPKEAGILKSMLLGDKSDLDSYTSELYKSAGIYHILAISGLHVSVINIILNFILERVFNKKISSFILIIFLFFYCLMTGTNISTVRAVIISYLIIISNLIHRDNDLLTSLSLSGLLIMIFNPFCIFDIGFEYSFGAVFGIAVFTQAINRGFILLESRFITLKLLANNYFLNRIINLKKYLSVSIAANLISYAITVYYFFYITPYSIFINLFILPNIAFLIIFGIIIGVLGLFNLKLASFFKMPVCVLLSFYKKICEIFIKLPFAKILIGHINICFLILYFIWLGFFIYMLYSFKNKFIRAKKYFLDFSLVLALFIFIIKLSLIIKPPEIIMLDVGQGDCFVIDYKQTFIIDGGGKANQDLDNNTGKNILIPFLDYKSKNYIDGVFVSHPDADHIIGIIELIEHKNIGQIFLSQKNINSDLLQKLLDTTQKFSVPVEYLKAGDILSNKNLRFDCLYPLDNKKPAKKNNNNSLVLKLSLDNIKVLFTGDIEKEAETELLNNLYNKINQNPELIDIKADILKLAHHGSKTSSTLEFLKKANPSLAIVSTGKNNPYSHPSQEVINRLKNLDIPIINTAESGAVTIRILDNSLKIKTQIQENQKNN